ncbi:POTRA domain-containing protein [Chitinophaga sp.]|uniref:POTRA domain-containing protein n=1 Tax=Chitinophaga sp. TaxID=1869181 RepID=UPI0026278039|nr:POTRA domain-containing protein [uncultured Chitinophaga sp.]
MRTVFNISGLWLCLLAALPARAQVADSASQPAPEQLTVLQDTSYIVVRDIVVTGNKRTRRSVILREIGIKPGDTLRLRNLQSILETNRKQLLNTSLFLNVLTNVKDWNGNEANVVFDVWERWYLLAFPVFKLADRNFNQWWVEQKKSLRRVNVGVKAWQDNLTGRNDELYTDISFGYTQKFVLGYTLPYIDRKLRHGIGFSASFSRNREINYISEDNKQQFFRQDDFLRRQMAFGVSYTYRKAISTRHQAFLTYHSESVADSVAKLNPNYLGDGRTSVHYAELVYRLDYIQADSWQYPLVGQSFRGEVSKAGLGPLNDIDFVKIRLKGAKYWQFAPKTYGAVSLLGQVKFPNDLPYAASRALGYGDDYLRGLEYYVVDGTAFFILKNTLRRELLNFKVRLPIVPKKFSNLPVRVLAKAYGDMGYGYSKLGLRGDLSNRMLYTAGVGLDVVSFYDTCIRFEYSINQLGEKGLFLHAKLDM